MTSHDAWKLQTPEEYSWQGKSEPRHGGVEIWIERPVPLVFEQEGDCGEVELRVEVGIEYGEPDIQGYCRALKCHVELTQGEREQAAYDWSEDCRDDGPEYDPDAAWDARGDE